MPIALGWFADVDEERCGDYVWQPVLQLDGACLALSTWFNSEEACVQFIQTEIVGRCLLDSDHAEERLGAGDPG